MMRIFFFFSILLIGLIPFISVNAQDSSLVAYYPFSGGVTDSSGFGFTNEGEIYGGLSSTNDRFGNEGSAYKFDGVDDYINTNTTFDFPDRTTSFWFKADFAGIISGETQLIINQDSHNLINGALSVSLTGSSLQLSEGFGNSRHIYNNIVANKWYHITLVRKDSIANYYLNNELLVSIESGKVGSSFDPNETLLFGVSRKKNNSFFHGLIDDMRIYNYAISDSAISELYFEKGWPETEYVIPDTLVAHYPFTGNALDSSGFGNNGEVLGANLTRDRFGNENSAYEFDGIDDYINTNATFDFKNRSVSVWVKLNIKGFENQAILDQDSNTSEYGAFGVYQGGEVFRFREGNTEDDWEQDIEVGKWYHLAMIREDSLVRGYLNGEQIGVGVADKTGSGFEINEHLIIGANRSYSLNFNGVIDDIRIYNYAISDSAISDLYSEKGWPETKWVLPDTLVAYYPFSGNAQDSSGFSNNGEVFEATLTRDRFGNENSAYKFDGIGNYIDVAHNEVFNSEAKTVSFWFKKESNEIGESSGLFMEGLVWKAFDTGYSRDYSFSIENISSPFDIYNNVGNGTDELLTNRIEDGIKPYTWYHVVGIIDSTKSDLYINGEFVQSVEKNWGKSFSNSPITIGRASLNSKFDRYFKGTIDDLSFYNYSLSDSSIKKLYHDKGWPETEYVIPDTLVAHYPFTGNASDFSGFENHGEVFGATLTRDRFGNENSAYDFDGNHDFIKAGTSETLTIRGDLTLSFWFKTYSFNAATSGIITYQGSNEDEIERNALYKINFPGENIFNYNHEGENASKNPFRFENTKLQSNKWYYIALTRDTTNKTLKLYVDGVLADSGSFSTVPFGGEFSSLRIGENHGTTLSDRFFNGILDDIRIYNYTLSDSTISDFYSENGWPETEWVLPDTLVAYYPFDGNTEELSGFGNNGSAYGVSPTVDRFGNLDGALKFDGRADLINTNTSFDYPERSVSIWVKPDKADSAAESQIILNQDYHPHRFGAFGLSLTRGQYRFKEGDTEPEWGVNASTSKWTHIVMVRQDTMVRGYINGELVGSGLADSNASKTNPNPTLLVGTSRLFDRHFDGDMDDLRIYNYAISDSAISNLYTERGWPETGWNASDTLVAYYPFTGNAYDSSGFENHGEVLGPILTKDRFGNENAAYEFDGVDDLINFGNDISLDIAGELTLSVWAKGKGPSTAVTSLIGKTSLEVNDGGGIAPFGIALDDGDRLYTYIENGNENASLLIEGLTTNPDEWTHYVSVFKPDEYLKIFRNGELLDRLIADVPSEIESSTRPLIAGARSNAGSQNLIFYFDGVLDDIRVYSKALTDTLVKELYKENGWPASADTTLISNENELEIPDEFNLYQNYPNPFNPSTIIKYDLSESGFVSLRVYDITGRLVAVLIDENKPAGRYEFSFHANGLSSGIYFYSLKTHSYSSIGKFTLIK